jgi:hypothetical protein
LLHLCVEHLYQVIEIVAKAESSGALPAFHSVPPAMNSDGILAAAEVTLLLSCISECFLSSMVGSVLGSIYSAKVID